MSISGKLKADKVAGANKLGKLEISKKFTDDSGNVIASYNQILSLSASIGLTAQQQGSHIVGNVSLVVDTGLGISLEFTLPFDIDTGLDNPIYVDLGSIELPIIGRVEVVAMFSYDIPQRLICAAITLEGVLQIAQQCANF